MIGLVNFSDFIQDRKVFKNLPVLGVLRCTTLAGQRLRRSWLELETCRTYYAINVKGRQNGSFT